MSSLNLGLIIGINVIFLIIVMPPFILFNTTNSILLYHIKEWVSYLDYRLQLWGSGLAHGDGRDIVWDFEVEEDSNKQPPI